MRKSIVKFLARIINQPGIYNLETIELRMNAEMYSDYVTDIYHYLEAACNINGFILDAGILDNSTRDPNIIKVYLD